MLDFEYHFGSDFEVVRTSPQSITKPPPNSQSSKNVGEIGDFQYHFTDDFQILQATPMEEKEQKIIELIEGPANSEGNKLKTRHFKVKKSFWFAKNYFETTFYSCL